MDEKPRNSRAIRFLPDGRESVIEALRAEIEAKYADELEGADEVWAAAIYRLIEQEVNELAARYAPRDGLY